MFDNPVLSLQPSWGAGWERVLEAERAEFRRRQLRAAIRNDPGTAMATLRDAGYTVTEPDRSANVMDLQEKKARRGGILRRSR